jgi:zinc protease
MRRYRGWVLLALAGSWLLGGAATAAPAKPRAKAPAVVLPAAPPIAAVPAPVPPPAAPELVRELGGISEYRLANGLQILLLPDASKPTTTVNLTYKVGSRHEGPGEAGMAHLLEHLLFKGTPEYADISGEFARRGMRFNGTTTVDRTNYFSSFNADDETLAFALKLEANRMLRSRIAQADLDQEMPVVRNELEIGENNPAQLLRQRVMSLAYRFHPYGQPTIGTRSDVENVPIERLQAFYRQHYRPDNAVLIVAGRIDPPQTLALITREFGPLPRPAQPLRAPYTVEPPQDGERMLTLRRARGAPLVLALYHVPAMAHPDCAALAVLGHLLAQPPGGGLYKALVDSKLATQVFAGGCGGHDPGVFNIGAAYAAGTDLRELERQLLDGAEGRGGIEFKPEEVQRVVAQFELGYRQLLQTPERAVLLLSDAAAAGDWRLIFKTLEAVRTVTPDEVRRVAKTYLQPANRSLGHYLPLAQGQQVEVPPVADRSAGLDGLKIELGLSDGESFDPTPVALQARTEHLSLPSGIRLALLPKRNRGDSVSLLMQLRWAALPEVMQASGAGFVGPLMSEGSARQGRQALIDAFTQHKGSFRINAGPQGAAIQLQAERDGVLPLLALLQDVLMNPALPPEAFERLKTQALGGLSPHTRDPETLRQEAVRAHYNRARGLAAGQPGYQWSRREREAQVRSTRLADVQQFHQRYWSANQAEITVVGTLPEGLPAEIERLFGSWKKPGAPRFERWLTAYHAVPPLRLDVQAGEQANAVMQLRQELRLSSRHEDHLALLLANHMLGGGLDSRLAKRLRQQDGFSYRLGSQLQADRWDEAGALLISINFAPENRERVLAAVQDEIARLLEQGFAEDELAHARNDVLQGRRQARSNDGALAGALLQQLDSGEDWLALQATDQRLSRLTLAEVNAALRRHLRPEAWVISSAGDYRAKPVLPASPN